MKTLPFKLSETASIGVELEYQLIDPNSFALISCAKELIRNIQESPHKSHFTPEITQSMIEINTSVHRSTKELYEELKTLHDFMLEQVDKLHVLICGGGTHPFHRWADQKIFPSPRYKKLAKKYQYLSKRGTVFGQHIHIGCATPDDAIYLTHALARYVPHLIAMAASSPFYQGVDAGFASTRSTIFNSFPLHGTMPWLLNWDEFTVYFYKMHDWDIIHTMKDFYWDIRPKPEFGTVEIRVTDTPLTIRQSVNITAYLQSLALYLLEERPMKITHDLYYLYETNRFEASRYGYEGKVIDPFTFKHVSIQHDIEETVKKFERYANKLGNMPYITQLMGDVLNERNDSTTLRELFKQTGSFNQVVEEQCKIWMADKIK